jgi:hypothetical protein
MFSAMFRVEGPSGRAGASTTYLACLRPVEAALRCPLGIVQGLGSSLVDNTASRPTGPRVQVTTP